MFIGNDFHDLTEYIDRLLGVGINYDMVKKEMTVAGRKACYYYIDGFCKDDIMEKMMEYLFSLSPDDMPDAAYDFMCRLPFGETELIGTEETFIKGILTGVPMLIVEGYGEIISTDFRTYPARPVTEPEKDKVMRGSKDGFVETIAFNTALIRRRIRDPRLTMEIFTVGKSSKTDIVVSYMRGRASEEVLAQVVDRIKNINVDSLTMNQESFVEAFYPKRWFNPFPKFKFSERPDTTAACILEGNIAILIDNAPSAIIVPSSIFDIVEDADDYYFPPITGTYLRLSRFVINIMALLVSPTFLLLINNPQYIPSWLQFIVITDPINVPIVWQMLMLEFAIDGMRLASLNTPNMLSTPLSIVAGIVLGDFTVSSGWFNSEIMLYMAFVAVANYSQVNFELGYALKFMRVIALVFTSIWGIYGYSAALILSFLGIVCNKTFSGKSYLYPIFPFDGKKFLRRFIRVGILNSEKQ